MLHSIHSSDTPVSREGRPIEQTGDGQDTRTEAARQKTDRIELSDAARKLARENPDVSPEITETGA